MNVDPSSDISTGKKPLGVSEATAGHERSHRWARAKPPLAEGVSSPFYREADHPASRGSFLLPRLGLEKGLCAKHRGSARGRAHRGGSTTLRPMSAMRFQSEGGLPNRERRHCCRRCQDDFQLQHEPLVSIEVQLVSSANRSSGLHRRQSAKSTCPLDRRPYLFSK